MTRRGLAEWSAIFLFCLFNAGCSRGGSTEVDDAQASQQDALQELHERVEALGVAVGEIHDPPDRPPGAAIPSLYSLAERMNELERSVQTSQSQVAALQAQQAEVRRVLQLLPLDFRLDMKLTMKATGTLEQLLTQISSLTGLPIRIQSDDLGEARIPRIRDLELAAVAQPIRQLLAELLIKANPDPTEPQSPADPKLLLVYVVANDLNADGRQEILVTTRKRAAQRGLLPEIFKAAK